MNGSEVTGHQAGWRGSGRNQLDFQLTARALTHGRVVRLVDRGGEYDHVGGDLAERSDRPGGG
jgi:hypothetical protein